VLAAIRDLNATAQEIVYPLIRKFGHWYPAQTQTVVSTANGQVDFWLVTGEGCISSAKYLR
jgi:hypothetical protein